jgi:hypothetical protein
MALIVSLERIRCFAVRPAKQRLQHKISNWRGIMPTKTLSKAIVAPGDEYRNFSATNFDGVRGPNPDF